ncbi:putative ABC transport system permease protein [Geosporobacter subterraneus DSM 17957]|uniref:Putative ABC transport system permease protein n=1 Tax=Geosporobacter subterraneus DSM 17957 TaxID=1121919 RepID=A0A1M6D5A7_9FIRM|nr:iron export ABC transporter permease subunit FetB [Geosporobacter subterraneus]SHI68437.1 putative ABC transport system permease protein [Geosporobacter subterraneus DSM 17957]
MNIFSLSMASLLMLIPLAFSKVQKLHLEKEILIGTLRAVLQLSAIGFVLKYIFNVNNGLLTFVMILIMMFNASYLAAQRGKEIKNSKSIAFYAISAGTITTLGILIAVGSIEYVPSQVIPISGMIVGNSMVAVGLTFKQLRQNYLDKIQEIEVKLSLGASAKEASIGLIRDAVKTGMMPTVDSMKTLGIIQLPGMMTGLILAGVSPLVAIQYQILVTFMLSSAVSISAFTSSFLAYREFFNERVQLTLERK